MKAIRFVLVVLILSVFVVPASAQENEYDDETYPIEFSAVGLMQTDALWLVTDLRQESKGVSIFATGRYKIGLSLQKGRWMTTVYRFRDNVPTSYEAVLDPKLVREYWGWQGEVFYVVKATEHFEFGPLGAVGVGWYQERDRLFPMSIGGRIQYGPAVMDAVLDSNAQGISLAFGLRLR
jgi:hypothetical protein